MVRCRSGLWDQISLPILVGWENAPLQYPHTEADFMSLLTGQKTLPFQPGSQYRYSSGDYFLLGIIVKRISGQPLAEFARKRIFEPLGMTRTFFEEDPTRVVEQRAVGHYKRVGDAWHLWRPTAYMVGGFALKTCVDDLYRWDQNFAHNRSAGREGISTSSSERARSWGIALSWIWMPPSRKSIPRRGASRRPASTAGSGAGNSRVVRGASMPR